MRTLKSSMKNFFATIFCFLMNLIPGKSIFARENIVTAGVTAGNHARQAMYEKRKEMHKKSRYEGKQQFLSNNRYVHDYIEYLYEYVDNLLICKNNNSEYDRKISTYEYEDTG